VSPALPVRSVPFDATAFCSPFVFMVLRIASPATPLYSHLYKLPGVYGFSQSKSSSAYGENKLTTLQASTYELFVVAKTVKPFGFKQLQTLFPKHPGGGTLGARRCSVLALSSGVKIGPQLAKLPHTRLGAIIPLCTPRVWRRALAIHDFRHSLASRHRFSWG
jgi:hypothetical protein